MLLTFYYHCSLFVLILPFVCVYGEDVPSATPVTESSSEYKSYEEQLKDLEYRTSADDLGIEPYGEEAAARIWSPTRLIPAEEWSGFYSGPVSDEWATEKSSDQVASESESNSSSVALDSESKPYPTFSLNYQDTPKRETGEELKSRHSTSTTSSPSTSSNYPVSTEPILPSDTEYKEESKFRRESVEEEGSEYGRREDRNDEDYKVSSYETSKSYGHHEVSDYSTQSPASLFQYQLTPIKQASTPIVNDQAKSESIDFSGGPNVVPALSRIETEELKHEAVHFNQTYPVVYDPIAKAQSESSYLKHSPLSKHDPFDKKIHAYQYIFGQGPAHNDGKLHSFEETHEYHYPTQYLKRSDRHEVQSSSSPLGINFKTDRYSEPSSSSNDDSHNGWKYRADREHRTAPGKAHAETYFYEGDSGRKNVIYNPGSERAASKTVEMGMRDWNDGSGHVSSCHGTGCRYRPSSGLKNPSSDLSPIRPFSSFFVPPSTRKAPQFHSMYDDQPYSSSSSKIPSPQFDDRRLSSTLNHPEQHYKNSIPPPPRRPTYKASPTASFTTRPRVGRYESRHADHGSRQYRNRHHPASAAIYDYRSNPRQQSYDGAGSDRDNKFYRPKSIPMARNNYDDSYNADHHARSRYNSQGSSMITDPTPYYGPYQRFFPDLIASPSISSSSEEEELVHHHHEPIMDDITGLFSDANHNSNYNYDHNLNERRFW